MPDCTGVAGDTTWVLVSTALVLSMNPALAFFEAGMLRTKNTLSIVVQIFTGIILLSLLWFFIGYSLVFSESGSVTSFIGNLNNAFFINVDYIQCTVHAPHIPAAAFALFQMMFAVITPLLMTGAFAERMRFRVFVPFILIWEIIVYYPVAHWLWADTGFLGKWGALDFAGGIVIHTTAGAGSLVSALMLGRRIGFEHYNGEFPPSSMPLAAVGMAWLWLGWYGFNGGSALQAGSLAVSAVVSTQIGAVTSGATWLLLAWYRGQPSLSALMNGSLAGLAGITPCSGYIDSPPSILLGFILGISSFYAVHLMKHYFKVDDALDVSSVHGLTGMIGSIFTGLFSQLKLNPQGANGAFYGNPSLLGIQTVTVLFIFVYTAFWSYIILRFLGWVFGSIRVSEEFEREGLDYSEHGEVAYHKLHVLEDAENADIYISNGLQPTAAATTLLSPHSNITIDQFQLSRNEAYRRVQPHGHTSSGSATPNRSQSPAPSIIPSTQLSHNTITTAPNNSNLDWKEPLITSTRLKAHVNA